jgi:hypothetical protein
MSILVASQIERLETFGFVNVNPHARLCEIVRGNQTVSCAVDYDGGKYWVSVAWKWRGYKAPEPPKFRFCIDSGVKVPSWKLDKLFALGVEYAKVSQAYSDECEAEAQKAKAFREKTAEELRPIFCSLSDVVPQTYDEAETLREGFSRYSSDAEPFRKFQVVRYPVGAEMGRGYSVSVCAGDLSPEQVARLADAYAAILGKEGE